MSIKVLKFATKMEEKLIANNHKTGWGDLSLKWLLNRARQELKEVERAIKLKKSNENIQYECADVANFMMMISDNLENTVCDDEEPNNAK